MSIKTKTALAFAGFALVCVGATGALLLRHEQVHLRQALVERQRLFAANRALMVRDQLDLAQRELVRLSRMAEIDMDDANPAPERQLLAQAYRQTSFFNHSIHVYGNDGRCRWAQPSGAECGSAGHATAPWSSGPTEEASPAMSFEAQPDGKGLIHLAVPILGDDREVTGVLRGSIDLETDRAISFALQDELAPGTLFALVDRGGRSLYQHPELREPLLRRATSSRQADSAGSTTTQWNGRSHLLTWAPVDRADLAVVFAWPWKALHDAGPRLLRQLLWLLLGLGAVALTVGLVSARALTRPVLELVEQVHRVERERDASIAPTTKGDEVGQLRNAFSKLVATLRDQEDELRRDRDRISELAEGLERRVDERTKQLQEAQEALVRAERLAAVGQAGALLSHELRNSLNAMSVGIDALIGQGGTDRRLHQTVARSIRSEVARLLALSDDLLAFARDPQLRLQATGVRELLRDAVDRIDDYADEHQVHVELLLAPDLDTVTVDTNRIQTAILNLLRNGIEAAQARPSPRTVLLRARSAEDELWLTIEDSGDGIDPEVKDRLFQPFVTSKHAGVGLGLAVAARFVRAHGGELSVTDGMLGGACFQIRLPMHASEERMSHGSLRVAN